MVRFIAFDFILRIILAGVVRVAFIIKIRHVYFHDFSGYVPCLRVPLHVVAHFKFFHRVVGLSGFTFFKDKRLPVFGGKNLGQMRLVLLSVGGSSGFGNFGC